MLQALADAAATAHIGAAPHERTDTRTTQRNGTLEKVVTQDRRPDDQDPEDADGIKFDDLPSTDIGALLRICAAKLRGAEQREPTEVGQPWPQIAVAGSDGLVSPASVAVAVHGDAPGIVRKRAIC